MADAWYNDAPNNLLGNGVHGQTDWDTDDIRVVMRDEGVTALNLAHQDLDDIAAGARIAVSANLTSKTVGTVAGGTFDHADETLVGVSGASVESLDYYEHTGVDATSPLLCNLDSWTGLPFTPSGGNVILAPNASGVLNIS